MSKLFFFFFFFVMKEELVLDCWHKTTPACFCSVTGGYSSTFDLVIKRQNRPSPAAIIQQWRWRQREDYAAGFVLFFLNPIKIRRSIVAIRCVDANTQRSNLDFPLVCWSVIPLTPSYVSAGIFFFFSFYRVIHPNSTKRQQRCSRTEQQLIRDLPWPARQCALCRSPHHRHHSDTVM